jgi:hypothetical protein
MLVSPSMKNPPFRGPREKIAGLFHLGRMLDKIRLHLAGNLPAEYQRNLGLSFGLDGHLCGFLDVKFEALCVRVQEGGTDEELVEWCFAQGLRPNQTQIRIWNEFARKFGWNDRASAFVTAIKAEDGAEDQDGVWTAFDSIDFREGRALPPAGSAPA